MVVHLMGVHRLGPQKIPLDSVHSRVLLPLAALHLSVSGPVPHRNTPTIHSALQANSLL
jgi:hypothetical protein